MTIQDLKDNRAEIIEEIQLSYSHANVKEFMTAMVNMLPLAESNDVIDYVGEVGELMFQEKININASKRMAEINRANAIKNLPSSMR